MKIKVMFEQDAESPFTDWQSLEKDVEGWLQACATTTLIMSFSRQDRTVILEYGGDDIVTVVGDLHKHLYDSRVNFTLTFL